MTAFDVVQVSDTHLSRNRGYFYDNWRVFLSDMRAAPPDLIVHSGDLSLRGTDDVEDLLRPQRSSTSCPVRCWSCRAITISAMRRRTSGCSVLS